MSKLKCYKCVLQHFLPCGDQAHFDDFRVAVRHYLGVDVREPYAGYLGDPQAPIWACFAAKPVAPERLVGCEPQFESTVLVERRTGSH